MKKYISVLLVNLFGMNIFIYSLPEAAITSKRKDNNIFDNKQCYCYMVNSSNSTYKYILT